MSYGVKFSSTPSTYVKYVSVRASNFPCVSSLMGSFLGVDLIIFWDFLQKSIKSIDNFNIVCYYEIISLTKKALQ